MTDDNLDPTNMRTLIDHHLLAAVAVISLSIVGSVSILTGHDGLEVIIAAIVAITGGAPMVGSWVDQRGKTTFQAMEQGAVAKT